jgi:hypothetical protein
MPETENSHTTGSLYRRVKADCCPPDDPWHSLPFVVAMYDPDNKRQAKRRCGSGRHYWTIARSGDDAKDELTGAKYAADLLTFLRRLDCPGNAPSYQLWSVIQDMIEGGTTGALEWSFINELARYAMLGRDYWGDEQLRTYAEQNEERLAAWRIANETQPDE